MDDVRPGAEPFRQQGDSDVAILLVHGFTGSPASMRPWGDYLNAHGYTVFCPRLPGHGTKWQDMEQTTWQEWYAEAARDFEELLKEYRLVFVAGLSMGAALSLRLAEARGADIAGLMLVNPAVCRPQRLDVPVLVAVDRIGLFNQVAKVMRTVPGIKNDIKKPGQDEVAYDEVPIKGALQLIKLQDTVRSDLGKVVQPLLVFSAPDDHVVEPVNSGTVMSEVGSLRKTQIMLPESYHVATLDNDAETIFADSLKFIQTNS
jgi:carboxylesterase